MCIEKIYGMAALTFVQVNHVTDSWIILDIARNGIIDRVCYPGVSMYSQVTYNVCDNSENI